MDPACSRLAVLLGDTVMDSTEERCVTRQLVDVYEKYGCGEKFNLDKYVK